tara:strand:- start:180 stop:314 length:135 start_codon:yes stop_codon:yes gene_type:complete
MEVAETVLAYLIKLKRFLNKGWLALPKPNIKNRKIIIKLLKICL